MSNQRQQTGAEHAAPLQSEAQAEACTIKTYAALKGGATKAVV
jgi:hypothetical protein